MQHFAPNSGAKPAPRGQKSARSGNTGGTTNQPAPNLEPARENAVAALRIFRPPLRAAVTLREGRPARIACQRRKEICGEVLWAAGPWRTSGDWWEQEGWARDEWDIALQETTGIALYRLVRDLLSGQWRVEGNYD